MKRLMLVSLAITCLGAVSFAQAKQTDKKEKPKTETTKKSTETKKTTEVKKTTTDTKKEAVKPAEKKKN